MSLCLAVDAMGGDYAPKCVIEGIRLVVANDRDVNFLLFGDEKQIKPLLDQDALLRSVCEIIHTDEVVTSDTTVIQALRNLKNSSMRLAIQAVASKEAQGVISSGNTGAYMALSKMILKTLDGISRPAIAGIMPTAKGHSIALDLGANVEASPENLVQFSLMGLLFSRCVLGVENPTFGLLNVGVEELKGHDQIKLAYQFLKEHPISKNFLGYVEGDDITKGNVDVIVTDGFTGNIALKAMEGTARLLLNVIRSEIEKSFIAKIGALLASKALKATKLKLNPHGYNGAPFLGLRGIAVKSHGSTNEEGFANAIKVALGLIRNEVNEKISEELNQLSILMPSMIESHKSAESNNSSL